MGDSGNSMKLLFTYSDLVGSEIIRMVTEEPVSHVALLQSGLVLHMRHEGLVLEPESEFRKKNIVLYTIDVETPLDIVGIAEKHWGRRYDFGALAYLGFRFLFPKLLNKKQNLWNNSGMFICTELVTDALGGEPDAMITPYNLYLQLEAGRKEK